MPNAPAASAGHEELFVTTHWSVVLAAGAATSSQCQGALEELCRAYWYPIYAYLRRRGYGHDDAHDLTQEFFTRIIGKSYLDGVSPQKGKFRAFLLRSLNHFLINEWDRMTAQKRGGGCILVSLDDETNRERYAQEPSTQESIESFFDKRWAFTILERALATLDKEFAAEGKAQLFQKLKNCLSDGRADYAPVASELGLTPKSAAMLVFRMRQRYRQLVRAQVAQTVTTRAELEEELRELRAILSQ